MRIHIKHICFIFLASLACMYMLDAYAAKPVKITVTEAVPNEAIQGDALPVRIKGTGFDPGSSVKFIVTDTKDDTQIEVGTVIYESETGDLVAHVKVKDQALVIDYDVEVTTSSGRRGKGTTLFRVREQEGQEDPCVFLTSYFPAFSYVVSWDGGFEIFLASANGDCTVPIYTGTYSFNGDISYRYYDQGYGSGLGLISWAQNKDGTHKKKYVYPVIRMLEFTVSNNVIVETLPLSSELLYMGPETFPVGNTYAAGLNPAGDRILFGGFEDYTVDFLNEMELVDCASPPCITRVIDGDHDLGLAPARGIYGLSEDRIYLMMCDSVTDYLPNYVTFIDRLEGGWTEPGPMLGYGTKYVSRMDAGLWDYDMDGLAEEVLAVSTREFSGVHEIDIWGCLGEAQWCLVDTITGEDGAFKSIDGHPVVLFEYTESTVTGPAILEYDLETGSIRTVIDVITGGNERISGVDSAD